jgi:hypothetical protein
METTRLPRPSDEVTDDVIAVRIGTSIRIHGFTADREDGYCREVRSDMRRAGITCDPAEMHFVPDGETTLATIHQTSAPDLTWTEFATNLVVLPCGADAIRSTDQNRKD